MRALRGIQPLYHSSSIIKVIILWALYNKITIENTSASYYRSSSKEMIYNMDKKTTS